MAYEDAEFDSDLPAKIDKKAGLTRVPKKAALVADSITANNPPPTAPVPKVAPFEPAERNHDDRPPNGEKYEVMTARKKEELRERDITVARMTPTEQLGFAAGQAADAVKKLRADLKFAEQRVAKHRQDLAEAVSLLDARLDELRKVGL